MNNSKKLLKTLSSLIENGILTSKDIQSEISDDFKFRRDNLINKLRDSRHHYVPAILITATSDSDIEEKTKAADVGFMRKLVKPASLRAMMSAMLANKLQSKYLE